LLARDLRFKLCGNATQCPQVRDWTLGNFWGKMAAGTLFGPVSPPDALNTRIQVQRTRQQQANRAGRSDPLWDAPWLLCTTNSSGQTCQGSIRKADWLSGDRTAMCRAVLTQPNAPSAAVDLSLCDLDSSLNSLCSVIQAARYRVFEANCQLTGQCRTTSFFYQPATYALDDNAFVRSVVGTFYNFTSQGACPITDDETRAILASNAQTVQNCPAQDLQALQFSIQIAREALHSFVIIGYYTGLIAIEILSLITTSDASATIATIVAYFNRISSEFQQFFSAFGDLMFKLIMESGRLGKVMRAIVTRLCVFLNEVFNAIIQPFVCLAQSAISAILGAISSVVGAISYLVGGALNGVSQGLSSASDAIAKSSVCYTPSPFPCDSLFAADTNLPTALPLPTRCWVGYIPAAGDRPQDGLGCSAADTCMDDDGSLRACASCQASLSGASYGCDSLTKLCR
jgi:hypothetical protein